MMLYSFRKIKKNDRQALLNFFNKNKVSIFFDPFPLNEDSVDMICRDKKNLYFGVFLKNIIIGFGMLRWHKNYKSPTLGLLVNNEHRGKGLGSLIYANLFKKAEKNQCREVIAIVHKNNIPSMRIAKKLGMVEINEKHLSLEDRYDFTNYFKTYKDKVILIKTL